MPLSEGSSARAGPAALFSVSLHRVCSHGGKRLTCCPGGRSPGTRVGAAQKWLREPLHGALQLCFSPDLEEPSSMPEIRSWGKLFNDKDS